MTIDEAIKIQDRVLNNPHIPLELDEKDAIKLGIEALKRHKAEQSLRAFPEWHLLPGKTKD